MVERHEMDDELSLLEEQYAQLYARNKVLKADYANVQEMRSSTKENAQRRIDALQVEINEYSIEAKETECIEVMYTQQNEKLRKLEEKVVKSEKARRIISNRIQDIRGNVSCYAMVYPSLHPSDQCLDVSPDETKILIRNPLGKVVGYPYDRVFMGTNSNEEIVDSLSDLFYTVFDGKSITVLNYGVHNLHEVKERMLFGMF